MKNSTNNLNNSTSSINKFNASQIQNLKEIKGGAEIIIGDIDAI